MNSSVDPGPQMTRRERYLLSGLVATFVIGAGIMYFLIYRTMRGGGNGPLAEPPRDLVGDYSGFTIWIAPVMIAVTLGVGFVYTRRTRSPMFIAAVLAGVLIFGPLYEPFFDWYIATWYPKNFDIGFEMFGRPIPWGEIPAYGLLMSLTIIGAWEVVNRGLAPRFLLYVAIAATVPEVAAEMFASQTHMMEYYSNHARLLGVPIYCIPQNGLWIIPCIAAVAWARPYMRGWRWILMPIAMVGPFPIYVVITTWPAYLAIHMHAGAMLNWTAAIIACILNIVVAWPFAYAPPLRRLREERSHSASKVPSASEQLVEV